MPDPDPWDFSEFADPDPRRPRAAPSDTPRPRNDTHQDPFAAPNAEPEPVSAADWTAGPGSPRESGAVEIARPPVPYLALAAGIALLALLLAALLGTIPGIAIVAWVLAGPIAIGVLAYFIKVDTTERARPIYAAPGWLRPAYVVAMVCCGIAVVVAALRIAFWVGRL